MAGARAAIAGLSPLLGLLPKLLLTAALQGLAATAAAQDRPVELELLLALDASASIDEAEFLQQRDGLAAAFRHPAVIEAVRGAGDLGIAVALMQWGHNYQQRISVPWTLVRGAAEAEGLARLIEASPRLFFGNGTSIAQALKSGSRAFEGNGFRGSRRAIDVSGDGRNNSGGMPAPARDALVADGFTINALAILDGDRHLGSYFQQYVIGGTAAFVLTARGFDDYALAIREKLLREILAPVSGLPQAPGRRLARR